MFVAIQMEVLQEVDDLQPQMHSALQLVRNGGTGTGKKLLADAMFALGAIGSGKGIGFIQHR